MPAPNQSMLPNENLPKPDLHKNKIENADGDLDICSVPSDDEIEQI